MKPLLQSLSRVLKNGLAFISGLLIVAQFTAVQELDPSIIETNAWYDQSKSFNAEDGQNLSTISFLQQFNLYPYWLSIRSSLQNRFAASDTDIQIRGEIKDLPTLSSVALFDMDRQEIIARAVSFRGKFKLAADIVEPGRGLLIVKKKYSKAIMIEPGESIVLAASYQELDVAIVKGGKEQALLTELERLSHPIDRLLQPVVDSILDGKYKDKEHKQRLMKKAGFLSDIKSNLNVRYGLENIKSYLGLNLTYHDRDFTLREEVKDRYEQLPVYLKASRYGKGLHYYLYERQVIEGDRYVDFEAIDINGHPFQLSDLEGRPILLNFWSAGCPTAKRLNQQIKKHYDQLSKKYQIVHFSLDNDRNWKKGSKEQGISWHNVSDLDGWSGRAKTLYEVHGVPSSYLIDEKGIVVKKDMLGIGDLLD